MKIHTQQTDPMRHLARALEAHRVAMLTLQDADGSLSSRPMTPIEMDHSGALWFIASRRTFQPLLTDEDGTPVTLAFVRHDASDYVAVRGLAHGVDDAKRKEELWSAAARPWFSGPEDPELLLLQVVPEQVDIWDGPDNAATRLLAMAASVAAGREAGLGSKQRIETPTPP